MCMPLFCGPQMACSVLSVHQQRCSCIVPESCTLQVWHTPALGDANMKSLVKGDVLQLERRGYFIVDMPLSPVPPVPGTASPIVLFAIPDGRGKSVVSPPLPVKGAPGGSSMSKVGSPTQCWVEGRSTL